MQIAVISFAMLTIILAITTYVFYAQSASASKDLEAKTKALSDKQMENNKLMYRVVAMQYVLGLKDVTKEQMEVAKNSAGGDDADVKDVLEKFDADMALVGDQVAPEARNYRTFMNNLLTALAKKNASVADSMQQVRTIQKAKDDAENAAKARADTAIASAEKSQADYAKESKTFADDRTTMEEQKTQLAAKITAGENRAKTEIARANEEKGLFEKHNLQLTQVNKRITEKLEDVVKDQATFNESPDGHITKVSQNQRLVWIDRGRADGLLRQTTFSVYDHNENGMSSNKSKGRIEVLTVGEHLSEARILEDKPSNPIIAGDVIETPAWSPGQRVHFALAMKMDINKDRIDDYDMIKSIIEMNGGVIDAQLRIDANGKVVREGDIGVDTRYFVQGEKPSETTSAELQKQFNQFDADRERFNVKKLSVDNLLALMGWRAEEKTVELAGSRGGFMKRSPGKSQPAASPSDAPASEGTTPAPAAAPADPFGSPAAAGPAVDPFGAPGAKATPAADVDPFATPK